MDFRSACGSPVAYQPVNPIKPEETKQNDERNKTYWFERRHLALKVLGEVVYRQTPFVAESCVSSITRVSPRTAARRLVADLRHAFESAVARAEVHVGRPVVREVLGEGAASAASTGGEVEAGFQGCVEGILARFTHQYQGLKYPSHKCHGQRGTRLTPPTICAEFHVSMTET